ncbi:hypothetical protein K435DRAFT_76583 [Dendrothele bispora CBS 962.96]|uniref:Uncharacterized protein n=1 Tax=Dendrothele bispora (strain CBS 962.96) TaxID=1314807 RepID=A0A4S8MRK9_DENBC|nr:hypothetical protein K435DRAFT_76583 [Dendrothele bispora CBS 962.96]
MATFIYDVVGAGLPSRGLMHRPRLSGGSFCCASRQLPSRRLVKKMYFHEVSPCPRVNIIEALITLETSWHVGLRNLSSTCQQVLVIDILRATHTLWTAISCKAYLQNGEKKESLTTIPPTQSDGHPRKWDKLKARKPEAGTYMLHHVKR